MPHAIVRERQRSRAKQFRQAMTPAETLLGRDLKAGRVDGLGFRRQTPIRNYIVDFVCHSAKMIIELDGASHDFEEQRKTDGKRDAFFVSEGFQVLHFTNEQVMSNLEGVVETIRQVVSSEASSLPPSLTLPHKGGGNSDAMQNITRGIRGSQP